MRAKFLSSRNIFISVSLIVVLAVVTCSLSSDNIHTVIPGQVYRSAQLEASTLKDFIKDKHLQSVFNLRGLWKHNEWYQQETALTKQVGIPQYDIKLHADNFPKPRKLKQLVNLLQTAPRPLLLHCRRGADRTSLASAIAIILKGEPSLAVAEKQISWRYGVVKRKSIGYLVFNRYKTWLHAQHKQHSKQNFLSWVNQL